MYDIESAIEAWKQSFVQHEAVGSEEAHELESHLRETTAELCKNGLSEHEAFMVGTHRLGHPLELVHEYAKIGSATQWRRRVLWMLTGYIAMTVGGNIISTLVAVAAMGMTFFGVGGATTGAAMVAVAALGWLSLLVLMHRQSKKVAIQGNDFSMRWGVAAVALLILAPLLTGSENIVRTRFTSISQYGESAVVYSMGGWTIQLCVCVACLILIRKLSEKTIHNAKTVS